MRTILLLSVSLPLFLLGGCDQIKKPRKGDRITYGYEGESGEAIEGLENAIWMVGKTKNTITLRRLITNNRKAPYRAFWVDDTSPMSEIKWVEKHENQVPMPLEKEVSDKFVDQCLGKGE